MKLLKKFSFEIKFSFNEINQNLSLQNSKISLESPQLLFNMLKILDIVILRHQGRSSISLFEILRRYKDIGKLFLNQIKVFVFLVNIKLLFLKDDVNQNIDMIYILDLIYLIVDHLTRFKKTVMVRNALN